MLRHSASQPNPWRIYLYYGALIVAAGALIVRLFYLQIVSHTTYTEYAYENRVSRVNDPAPRGVIYDSRMTPLVRNVPAYNIVITPADFPDPDDQAAQAQAIYTRLAEMLHRAAEYHDGETARWVERFSRTFEPLLMAAIGVVIGLIVLLLYMPIFELAGGLQ